MNRVQQFAAEVMAEALSIVPMRLRPLVACDLFCADPIFTGLHDTANVVDDRSYRQTAHVCFPYHVADRRTTVVMPKRYEGAWGVYVALHELGHVLHWNLQELAGEWDALPTIEPVNAYAATNDLEAFAEGWVASLYPPAQVDRDPYWSRWSRANDEFFDRLAVGP